MSDPHAARVASKACELCYVVFGESAALWVNIWNTRIFAVDCRVLLYSRWIWICFIFLKIEILQMISWNWDFTWDFMKWLISIEGLVVFLLKVLLFCYKIQYIPNGHFLNQEKFKITAKIVIKLNRILRDWLVYVYNTTLK